ncbi:MAG TPA: alpha/beta hydrolase [Micropepsaceae bacterium]|nr:alpha/beta hydrolase [Micropepsaceae bacterium]
MSKKIASVACAALLALATAPALPAEGPALEIATQGYIFAGGKYVDGPDGKYMSGQAYVEYQIPKNRTHPFPIVMIEGGGQSGSNFTGTPDGREGWAQYFLKRGYAVYVVDQPGRGRSALRPDYGDTVQRPTSWVQQQFTAPERSKLWPQARLHTQWPGTGMAGDPVFDQFYAQQLQAIASFPKQQELNRDAGAALLDQIGPAILLTHSQSGAFGWPIADARPKLVKAIVAIEPSGPPVHDGVFKGAPDYFDNGPLSKPWGIAAVPLAYGGVTNASQLAFAEQEKADSPDLMKCWRQKEPARPLTNLHDIPVVIISSEASYHASYDHCTAQYLAQAGVKNSFIRLADRGIRGNGHMMMLEKNNLQIAAVIEDWLGSTLH